MPVDGFDGLLETHADPGVSPGISSQSELGGPEVHLHTTDEGEQFVLGQEVAVAAANRNRGGVQAPVVGAECLWDRRLERRIGLTFGKVVAYGVLDEGADDVAIHPQYHERHGAVGIGFESIDGTAGLDVG